MSPTLPLLQVARPLSLYEYFQLSVGIAGRGKYREILVPGWAESPDQLLLKGLSRSV